MISISFLCIRLVAIILLKRFSWFSSLSLHIPHTIIQNYLNQHFRAMQTFQDITNMVLSNNICRAGRIFYEDPLPGVQGSTHRQKNFFSC